MNRLSILVALVATAFLFACSSEAPQDVDTQALYDQYGAEATAEGALPVEAVLAEEELYVGETVKLEGTVREVCQHRGCWLTLDTGTEREVRIDVLRDEDGEYKFTVPNDISGQRVVVSGMLKFGEPDEEADADAPPRLEVDASSVLVEKARA